MALESSLCGCLLMLILCLARLGLEVARMVRVPQAMLFCRLGLKYLCREEEKDYVHQRVNNRQFLQNVIWVRKGVRIGPHRVRAPRRH